MKPTSLIVGAIYGAARAVIAWCVLLGVSLHAHELRLPSYEGNPGATIEVPLTLDDASGIAGIRAQVNFDPELVTVTAVTAGGLGSVFDLDHETVDGQLFITLSRSEALLSGAGTLAVISFTINPGSEPGLFSDLALADYSVCDELGVDLRLAESVAAVSGRIAVNPSGSIDNDRDGIPDTWEEPNGLLPYELDSLSLSPGGIPFLLVYAFGLTPQDDPSVLPLGEVALLNAGVNPPNEFLTISFRRLLNFSTISYHVEVSGDLGLWGEDAVEIDSSANLDGTETAVYRDIIPVDSAQRRFIRVRVFSE